MAPDPKSKRGKRSNGQLGVVDQRVIKALAHPVRARALVILNERVASPNEIAQELGEGVGHVSYHINVLKDCQCIELVDTVPRRGAVEHYYRATSRVFLDDQDWRRLPPSVRPGLTVTVLQDLIDDIGAALDTGTFDARDDRHLSWVPMIVDEQGWKDMSKELEGLLGRVIEIQTASAQRLSKAEAPGVQVSFAAMAYEAPAGEERHPTPPKN